MNVEPYLRRDLRAVLRSRAGPLLGVGATLFAVAITAARVSGTPLSSIYGLLIFVGQVVFPGVGLALGVFSIVSHKESGSLRVLFTLPGRRRDVILGTFLSRAVLVGTAFGLLTLVVVPLAAWYGASPIRVVIFFALATMATLTGVSVGLLVSVLGSSQRQVSVTALGVYIVGALVWNTLFPYSPDKLFETVTGISPDTATGQSLLLLAPGNAYTASLQFLGGTSYKNLVASLFGAPIPSGVTAITILSLWVVLPVVFAIWWMDRTDVGHHS